MPRRSLRTVLTVWNAAALTGLLSVFGIAIVLTNQNRLKASIDEDLRKQAERAVNAGPPRVRPRFRQPFEGEGDPMGPGPGPMGQGQNPPPVRPGRQGPNGPQGPPEQNPPEPGIYADANRLSDIRRPRFFGRDGSKNPIDPVGAFDEASLKQALKGATVYADAAYRDDRIRVISSPIIREGRVLGAVQIAQELRALDLLWQTQLGTLAAFIPLAILAAAAGAHALTGRTLKPIRRLTRTASEIGEAGLAQRLEVMGDDEIADLAKTFNQMLDRLEASFTELHTAYGDLARAYEQQQRFTADASHELRTPLTRLRLATSAALREAQSPQEMRQALKTADRAAASMTRLVQDLLTLAKSDAGELPLRREPVDLRVVVAEALDMLGESRCIDTAFSERPLMIEADTEHLQRVVTNLVENAIRHTPPEGVIRVEAMQAQGHAVVSVRDTGEGISPEHLPKIFDRFYRVDQARARQDGGSGLGLAICKHVVEAHGGRLEIESAPGVGTTVRAIFPLFIAAAATQTKSS